VECDFDQVIFGEPASAKNRRRIVLAGGRPRLIKSAKALNYEKIFREQCNPLGELIVGDCAIWLDCYYGSRRPDLAAVDLIQDLLEGHAYKNDRQVKASASIWNLDKENPRVRVRVKALDMVESSGLSSYTPYEIWGMDVLKAKPSDS